MSTNRGQSVSTKEAAKLSQSNLDKGKVQSDIKSVTSKARKAKKKKKKDKKEEK